MTATMAETRRGHAAWTGAVARAMWPWCLLFIVGKPLLELRRPPYEWSVSSLRWLWGVAEDAALALPFLIFAGGVALVRVLGHSRRLVRTAVAVGISVGALHTPWAPGWHRKYTVVCSLPWTPRARICNGSGQEPRPASSRICGSWRQTLPRSTL